MPETRRLFKGEQFLPSSIIDRASHRAWEEAGALDTFERARARVDELLAAYTGPSLARRHRGGARRAGPSRGRAVRARGAAGDAGVGREGTAVRRGVSPLGRSRRRRPGGTADAVPTVPLAHCERRHLAPIAVRALRAALRRIGGLAGSRCGRLRRRMRRAEHAVARSGHVGDRWCCHRARRDLSSCRHRRRSGGKSKAEVRPGGAGRHAGRSRDGWCARPGPSADASGPAIRPPSRRGPPPAPRRRPARRRPRRPATAASSKVSRRSASIGRRR